MTLPVENVLRDLDGHIRAYARRFWAQDTEDVAQEGRIGVLTGYRTWRPDGGATVQAWCFMRAKGAMLDHARRAARERWVDGVQQPHPLSLNVSSTPVVPDQHDAYAAVDAALSARIDLERCRRYATPLQAQLLDLMLAGMTAAQASRARGVTEAATSRQLARLRRRITTA